VHPTPFADLNELLADFVAEAGKALGPRFVGAYLQGSFALGSADEWSDVDFVVVTTEPIDPALVQPLHARLFARATPWAQHLEGSYIPRDLLRRVDPGRTKLPFLDNGARELVLDSHCNTAVVRVLLREHGIALAGPPPAELIDAVAPAELRDEARHVLASYVDWALEPEPMSGWKQPYLVLTFCRALRTLEHADVLTKRDAATWAAETVDPRWRPLIQAALDDRPDPWARVHRRADPGLELETRAFARSLSRR
jgi:hypothetical protein